MSITIRDAGPLDAAIIAEFNNCMAVETEGHELPGDLIRAGVSAILGDRSKGRYWLAEQDSQIIGQIMVTYEWSDWRNGTMWWIQSVYVAQGFRRQGVFSALYRFVESLARADKGVCGLRLYVERSNLSAQETYQHLGMSKSGYEVMEADFSKTLAKGNEKC